MPASIPTPSVLAVPVGRLRMLRPGGATRRPGVDRGARPADVGVALAGLVLPPAPTFGVQLRLTGRLSPIDDDTLVYRIAFHAVDDDG